jgi:hypothetical protein
MSLLPHKALILWCTTLAAGGHSPRVLVFNCSLIQDLTFQAILADLIVVLLWKKSTLVSPTSLLDTLLDTPMPE